MMNLAQIGVMLGGLRMPQFSLTGITNIVALGDSITVGDNASPSSNGYINLFKSANSISTIQNQAVSGRGVWNQAQSAKTLTFTRSATIFSAMAGLNDMRRGGAATKTVNKIAGCYKFYFIKHCSNANTASGASTVTRSGGPFNNNSNFQGFGCTMPNGTIPGTVHSFAGTAGSYWEFSFTGNYVGIVFLGSDGSVGQAWGQANIYLDSVLLETVHTGQMYDGISDGAYDNKIGMSGWLKFDCGSGSHTLKVEVVGTGTVVVDFFCVPSPSISGPLVFFEIPYLNTAGYAQSPSSGSVAASDTCSQAVRDFVNLAYAAGFPVYFVETNDYYDLLTGLDADNIHPNNTGHAQIKGAIQSLVRQ